MDNYKDIAEKNLVEMRKKEEKAYKVVMAVIVFAIVLLLIWFAGQSIGEDIGTFIYNIAPK